MVQEKSTPKKEDKKVGKYLTEIKELPSYKDKDETMPKNQDKVALKSPSETEEDANSPMLAEKKIKPFSSRDIILAVINLISVVLLVVILMNLPKKAEEFKELRIEDLRNESGVSFEFSEVEESKAKKEKLLSLFLDESGVVEFVSEAEKLKAQGIAINKISFVSQEIVKDKTGNYGVPVVIEMSGSWDALGQAMQAVDNFEYLFRPVNISASLDENNLINLKYGGFLYVSDRLVKN